MSSPLGLFPLGVFVLAGGFLACDTTPPDLFKGVDPTKQCTNTAGVPTPLRRLTAKQYANTIRGVFKGVISPSEKFPQISTGVSHSGYSNDPEMNPITQQGALDVLTAAEEVAVAATEKLAQLLPCYPAQQNDACATRFITEYGRKLYRRPLSTLEQQAYLQLFTQVKVEGFELGIASVLTTLLQAPQFLYLTEPGSPQSATTQLKLSGYELATRLSYLLWDSTPDDALLDAAAAGDLDTPTGIQTQAERLLADPRAKEAIVRFFREWTGIKVYAAGQKDTTLFPDYDATLATSIQTQFDRFVTDAVSTDLTLKDLLSSKQAPVNARLARFYGISLTPGGEEFRPTVLPSERAAGLLTLPAVLAGLAHPSVNSVVQRGKFIRKKLLCYDLPDPPPDAIQRLPEVPATATLREKSEALRQVQECGGCHALLDPIGLGFEQFDAIGRFRTSDGGKPVDARGAILGDTTAAGDFNGVVELGDQLASASDVHQCMVKQWFRFTYGRRELPSDACTLETLSKAFADTGLSLKKMVLTSVLSPAFRVRALGGPP